MPIFPMDMTDNGFQLAKINVSDGISSHRVGKVYGFDGVANNLIYSAEFNAMTGATWTYAYGDGFGVSYVNDAGQKTIQFAVDSYGYAHMYFPVDLSQYTKLTVSCSYRVGYASVAFGFSANNQIVYTPIESNFTIAQLFKRNAADVAKELSEADLVFDLSQYNQTSAYFKMLLTDSSQAGGATYFTINKLILE